MRKYYLDNIRWITVVLVVLYHVIYMFNGTVTDLVIGPFRSVQCQDAIQYLLYPWFMVLLFVVSGTSSRYALERLTPKTFLAARTRKLLVPSTIGLFVFHWIGGYVNMQVTDPLAMPAAALLICKENHLSGALSYPITGAAAFLDSWLLYETISRIPVMRWCVLGIRKKVKKDVMSSETRAKVLPCSKKTIFLKR